MRIDCERCPYRRGAEACDDCLVTFVLQLEGEETEAQDDGEAVRLDAPQARAVRALSEAGLVEDVRVVRLEDTG